MKRVTGLGGVFFQADDPEKLYGWYEKHLGIQREPHGQLRPLRLDHGRLVCPRE
jgi:hypothetical protein